VSAADRSARLPRGAGGLLLLAAACGNAPPPVRLAAASSLSEVLPPLLARFEERGGVRVQAVFGGSGELAAQLAHGAPLDAVFLAGEEPMDRLERDGLLRPGTRVDLLRNRLVLAGNPENAPPPGPDLARLWPAIAGRRVAIGAEGVPAGDYARGWLISGGLDPRPSANAPGAPRLVPFGGVRAVLAAVESGSCAAGFVYESDLRESGLRVLLRAPEQATGPIRYPAAVTRASVRPRDAGALLAFLGASGAAFRAAGFLPVEEPAR